jgi:predicted SpoU family rRNA methylase
MDYNMMTEIVEAFETLVSNISVDSFEDCWENLCVNDQYLVLISAIAIFKDRYYNGDDDDWRWAEVEEAITDWIYDNEINWEVNI